MVEAQAIKSVGQLYCQIPGRLSRYKFTLYTFYKDILISLVCF